MLVISQNNIFTLYPNPASDLVNLNIDKTNNTELTLNIYNVLGACVRSETLKQNQINIADLSNGTYIIEVISDKFLEKQKLIIQR